MKVSWKWLREYVELPADLPPEKAAYDLTMTTVEVEGLERLGADLAKVVVGQVQALQPHPNADRLRLVRTDLGVGGVHEIVCGGSNLYEGMLVAVAEPGARVRWHGEGDLVELKVTKIRGVQSYGMICSAKEIGLNDLFPQKDDSEIVDLSKLSLSVGAPLAEALGRDDVVFEIDNKSLTNRPDLWGHYGIARELAAIYGATLKALPDLKVPAEAAGLRVSIHDSSRCRRYIGAVLEGVRVEPSPLWLQARLSSVGQRPIDLLVDLTNYVLFALGQPLHAFDERKIRGRHLQTRLAQAGEQLELLDEDLIKLDAEMLVIADEERPVALAGVMGGRHSGISADTSVLLLESANFEPRQTRRTAARLGVRTESSIRFEKGLDAARAEQGAKLFIALLQNVQPELKLSGWVDAYPVKPPALTVSVDRDFIVSRIGKDLPTAEIKRILEGLGFAFAVDGPADGDSYTVGVPSWRATGDVSLPEDIVEEVARVHGYDNLDFIPPAVELQAAVRQPRYDRDRRIKEYLAYSAGLNEIFSYPWVEDKMLLAAGLGDEPALVLAAAPAASSRRLQVSLVPNLLAAVQKNQRQEADCGFFEVARVFQPENFQSWSRPEELLPQQPKFLAAVISGSAAPELFRRAKGIVDGLISRCGPGSLEFKRQGVFGPWARPEAALGIFAGSRQVGQLALAAGKTLRLAEIETPYLALFEVNLSAWEVPGALSYSYQAVPRHPRAYFDLSVVIDNRCCWEDVVKVVQDCDPLIGEIHFSEEYQGAQIPAGKKSLSFQMVMGHAEKTLGPQEVENAANKVIKKLASEFGATLRA